MQLIKYRTKLLLAKCTLKKIKMLNLEIYLSVINKVENNFLDKADDPSAAPVPPVAVSRTLTAVHLI